MNLDFDKQQELLRDTARVFLRKEYSSKLAREIAGGSVAFPPELWKKMADLGWLGLVFPEEHGGAGGCFNDLAVLIEEMGRACFFSPFFSTVMAGLLILDAGSRNQKMELIPRIASGELILTLAIAERSGKWDAMDIDARATREDERYYVLEGVKSFVPNVQIANYIVTCARTDDSKPGYDGITLFLVDAKNAGLAVRSVRTIAGEPMSMIDLGHLRVPSKNVLGEVNKGWAHLERLLNYAMVAKCCEMTGGADKVLEMTCEYAKARKQFDQPIGSFQAIQHHCADMAIYLDSSRMITYLAASKLSQNLSCTLEAAMAKSWVGETYRKITALGQQIHAGVGFCEEHDLPLYYKHAKASEVLFGDADFHRERVAKQLVDG